ncbi:MAG: hypothetical protein ACLRIS_00830 [Flavonifractor plautii]
MCGPPMAEYREALCSDLGFLRYASRRLARIVVMNTFRATNDLLLPLENRLAAYLLSQAEDGWFHGTLTRTAETLSTSYRQLTRVMSRFAQAGYLRRTPRAGVWKIPTRCGPWPKAWSPPAFSEKARRSDGTAGISFLG